MNFEDEALRESEEEAMDNDAEEAPRDLEGAPLPQQPPGHVAPEVVPNKPVAEVPPLPVVVDALKQILAELDVKTRTLDRCVVRWPRVYVLLRQLLNLGVSSWRLCLVLCLCLRLWLSVATAHESMW